MSANHAKRCRGGTLGTLRNIKPNIVHCAPSHNFSNFRYKEYYLDKRMGLLKLHHFGNKSIVYTQGMLSIQCGHQDM